MKGGEGEGGRGGRRYRKVGENRRRDERREVCMLAGCMHRKIMEVDRKGRDGKKRKERKKGGSEVRENGWIDRGIDERKDKKEEKKK